MYTIIICINGLLVVPVAFVPTVSPYSPDDQFNMMALRKLEFADIKVLTSLEKVYSQMQSVAGVTVSKEVLALRSNSRIGRLDIILNEWESGHSHLPPTWESLLSVLEQLQLEELSQEIAGILSSES